MTGLLASVATVAEMELARAGGAAIVDLKNPSEGALGAWNADALRDAVGRWAGWADPRPLLSATIGDHPMNPSVVLDAVERMARLGVPLIKIGMFPGGDAAGCIASLADVARRARLIAVLFADAAPDFSIVELCAAASFHGAMIDTADKTTGGLRRHLDERTIADFVRLARKHGLIAGLAGSLTRDDVAPLKALSPDYLGFRGALCSGGRTGALDPAAVADIRRALDVRRAAA